MDHTNRLPWLIAAGAIMFALMVLIRSETAPDQPGVVATPVHTPSRGNTVTPTRATPEVPVSSVASRPAVTPQPATPIVTLTPAPMHTINGTVLDPGGKPIPKVSVRASFTNGGSRGDDNTITDAAGKFSLSKISAEELDALVFEARGFSSNVMNKVPLPLPEAMVVELTPVSGLDLTIVKAEAPESPPQPYSGTADITLFQRRVGNSTTQTLGIQEASVASDSFVPITQQSAVIQAGAHAMDDVDPGDYKVGVSTVGSYAESSVVTVASGTRTSTTITMGVQWTVSGRVVSDPEKLPVQQANVEIISSFGATGGRKGQHTGFTDSEGRFVLPEVIPGTYQVTIAASGFTTKTTSLIVEASTPPLASEFALSRQQPAMFVSVLDAEGKPIPQARLVLITDAPSPRTLFGKTDEAGSYRFEKLSAGTYSIAVTAPEERSRQKHLQVTIADGEVKTVIAQFGKQVRVSGKVKRGGKTYSGWLAFAPRGTVGLETMAKVDENGGFATDLEPGEYMVGRPEDPRSDIAVVPAGETANLELNIR